MNLIKIRNIAGLVTANFAVMSTAVTILAVSAAAHAGDDSYQVVTSTGPVPPQPADSVVTPTIEVYFSPGDAWLQAIVREILKAKVSVRVVTSQLNLKDVAGALANAQRTGVDVIVILDQGQLQSGGNDTRRYLKANGVRVLVDGREPIDSNILLIDDSIVISGSCGLTVQATDRAGNFIIIRRNQKVVSPYIERWNETISHGRTVVIAQESAPGRTGRKNRVAQRLAVQEGPLR